MSLYHRLSHMNKWTYQAVLIAWTVFFMAIIVWLLSWAMTLPFPSYDYQELRHEVDSLMMIGH